MKYSLKKIDLSSVRTVDDYNDAVKNTQPIYFGSLRAVEEYLGTKIRMRNGGWLRTDGTYYYLVTNA